MGGSVGVRRHWLGGRNQGLSLVGVDPLRAAAAWQAAARAAMSESHKTFEMMGNYAAVVIKPIV